jgi:hypothetical protein
MIAFGNDTCDKFFAGIYNTGEQLSPVTTTPVITFYTGTGGAVCKGATPSVEQ